MSLVVNTNVLSMNAQRNLGLSTRMLGQAMNRLSSGFRINSAADDAAGLAIAARLSAQARGLAQAVRNANDGISLLQTAEGAMAEISNILTRLKELAVQAANDTNSDSDRTSLDAEAQALIAEIDRISEQTRFGRTALLDGTFTGMKLQIGTNDGETVDLDIDGVGSTDLGVDGVDLTDQAGASAALADIDDALDTLSEARGALGAVQNRLLSTVANLQVIAQSVVEARSRIMDADFATETAALTKAQILQQAGIAVLAQANASPSAVLALLRG